MGRKRKIREVRRNQIKDALPDIQAPGQITEIDAPKDKRKPSEKRNRQR